MPTAMLAAMKRINEHKPTMPFNLVAVIMVARFSASCIASMGVAKATRPQATPQPATGIPVRLWISLAKGPSHKATQSNPLPMAQKGVPPERALTNSVQRKMAQPVLKATKAQPFRLESLY